MVGAVETNDAVVDIVSTNDTMADIVKPGYVMVCAVNTNDAIVDIVCAPPTVSYKGSDTMVHFWLPSPPTGNYISSYGILVLSQAFHGFAVRSRLNPSMTAPISE